jgi:hypothetical protein
MVGSHRRTIDRIRSGVQPGADLQRRLIELAFKITGR